MANMWLLCALVLAVPLIPPLSLWLTCFSQGHLSHGILADAIFAYGFTSNAFDCIARCAATGHMTTMSIVNCVADKGIDLIVADHGHGGPGLSIKPTFPWPGTNPPLLGPRGTYAFTHEAAKKVCAYPGKFPTLFILTPQQTMIDKEMVPTDLFPLVIQKDLQDPEHIARRKLIDEAFPALMKPPQFKLAGVPGVLATDLHNETAVQGVVAYLLIKSLFGLELDRDGIALFADWLSVFKNCGVNACPIGNHPKTKDDFLKIVRMMSTSDGGRRFQELAKKKGMDPHLRLQEMMLITLFAGYNGITDTTNAVMRYYNSETRDLFRKDPRAFVLEAARLNPAVNQIVPAPQNQTFTLGNGRSYFQEKGELVWNFFAASNTDPIVFGGASNSLSYAREFIPGRENADRLLNWNGDFRDILACGNTVGCPSAPRPCPGARLAVHIATVVATFFADADEASRFAAAKSEL